MYIQSENLPNTILNNSIVDMIIELLIFLVIIVILSSIFKIKEGFVEEIKGIDWLADQVYPDQLLVELLYDKFDTFDYKKSNGKQDQYENELRDIYNGKMKSRLAIIANKRLERISVQMPDFVVYPPFKRSYYGNIDEQLVLIIEKTKVTKELLKKFLADVTGNKALNGIIEGDMSITGNLAVNKDVSANKIIMGGKDINTIFKLQSEKPPPIPNPVKPCFSVKVSKSYEVGPSATVFPAINFDTKDFDTHDFYVNNMFKPKERGFYQLNWSVISTEHLLGGMIEEIFTYLSKNGVQYVWGGNYALTDKHWISSTGSALVYMDGINDYCQIQLVQKSGNPMKVHGTNLGSSRFSGFLVGPAEET